MLIRFNLSDLIRLTLEAFGEESQDASVSDYSRGDLLKVLDEQKIGSNGRGKHSEHGHQPVGVEHSIAVHMMSRGNFVNWTQRRLHSALRSVVCVVLLLSHAIHDAS